MTVRRYLWQLCRLQLWPKLSPKLWPIWLVLATATPAAYADVTAQLSAQVIDELETVRLVIRATQTRQTETLDLSELEQDFHILGTNSSSQYRFINGREQSWVDYQINLQPKRTGELRIPAIEVGNEITPSLPLRVRPLSDSTRQTISELVFFEQEVSAESIYVQSQLIVTRRLLYSNGVQLYSDLPDAPELQDAVVMNLGEATSSSTERNGKRYGVVEQRYAIFPEVSGQFTIPAINVTASVRLFEQGRTSRKGVRIGTEPQTITVKPMPPEYPADQPWLPAQRLQLHRVINPNQAGYEVGDTLTHELLIHIQGNVGSIAPPVPLTLDPDKFRTYPQPPTIADDTNGDQVTGSRLQTTSLLPLQSGTLVLPSTRVTWWNTLTDQLQTTTLESTIIQVTGGSIDTTGGLPEQSENEPLTDSPEMLDTTSAFDWRDILLHPWVMVCVGLAAGLFVWTNVRKLLRRWLPVRGPSPRSLQRHFNQALQNGEPRKVHQALTDVLTQHYQTTPMRAMQQFRQQHRAAGAALDQLAAAQYGKTPGNMTPDEDARQQLQTAVLALTRQKPGSQQGLPPLFSH